MNNEDRTTFFSQTTGGVLNMVLFAIVGELGAGKTLALSYL